MNSETVTIKWMLLLELNFKEKIKPLHSCKITLNLKLEALMDGLNKKNWLELLKKLLLEVKQLKLVMQLDTRLMDLKMNKFK